MSSYQMYQKFVNFMRLDKDQLKLVEIRHMVIDTIMTCIVTLRNADLYCKNIKKQNLGNQFAKANWSIF